MLPPIQKTGNRYSSGKVDLADIPLYNGLFFTEEPYLLQSDIPWKGRNQLISTAAPEYGDKLAHKLLGGKITVCVLCYGLHFAEHKRCLDAILRTVPLERLDLRIAANCVGQESMNYIKTLPFKALYRYDVNKYKYPIMRDMFYDPRKPITTNYIAWFDDNCYVSHNNWLNAAATLISAQKPEVAMYGIKLYYEFLPEEEKQIKKWAMGQSWYKGKYFRTQTGSTAPNGNYAHFCDDWFFILRTDAMRKANIPCVELQQVGGRIVIGEQLYQNGYSLKAFNLGKAYVYQPDYDKQLHRLKEKQLPPWKVTENGLQYHAHTLHA